eukprot:1068047-Amphidinium_carterae.1
MKLCVQRRGVSTKENVTISLYKHEAHQERLPRVTSIQIIHRTSHETMSTKAQVPSPTALCEVLSIYIKWKPRSSIDHGYLVLGCALSSVMAYA